MTRNRNKPYEEWDKDDLVKEAEEKGITVTRADGEEGEPLKSDYVAALGDGRTPKEKGQGVGASNHAHGNEPLSPEGLPPLTSDTAPVGVETTTGIPPARGKPVAGQPASFRRARVETEDERDERIADEAERSVKVRATRAGEYPPGMLRDIGNEFNYVRSQREVDEDADIPSWMEAIDDSGVESRTVGEPLFDSDKEERERVAARNRE